MGKTDTFLKKFEYREALDSVLGKDTQPPKVVSLLIELARRDGLKLALSNRNADALMPIMVFLVRYVIQLKLVKYIASMLAKNKEEVVLQNFKFSPCCTDQFQPLQPRFDI